jgi:transcriptional regulator with GAF, ATPase, and Fis domain
MSAPGNAPSPFPRPRLPSSPSAIVGRTRELNLLFAHLHDAIAGTGKLVLLSGEAGIGKMALAQAGRHRRNWVEPCRE